jgi:hypothetical protein
MDQVQLLLTIKKLEDLISETSHCLTEMEEAQAVQPRNSETYTYLSETIDDCMVSLERMETEIYNLSLKVTTHQYELLN